MGGSQSSNVAQATSEVSNRVTNSTAVNSVQLNQQSQRMDIYNCMIKLSGDLNFNAAATTSIRNQQVAQVKNNTNFNNNLQQAVLQEATSKVGSMGVGYSQASNNTSLFCSISNDILNTVSESADQFNTTNQNFNCTGSTIIAKNLNINFKSSTDFYNNQMLDNSNISDVTNKISQTVTQKAKSTVAGLGGFLIGIALIIAALGYGIAKPLSSGSTKIIVVFILLFILLSIGIGMYIAKAPPFFNDPIKVAVNSNLSPSDCDSIVNPQIEDINVNNAPIRYKFALIRNIGSNPDGIIPSANLADMAIIACAGGNLNNSGYNMSTYNRIEDIISKLNSKLPILAKQTDDQAMKTILSYSIPNLLTNPNTTAGIFYKIPSQYIVSSGKTDRIIGTCTPGNFTWDDNAATPECFDNWGSSCKISGNWSNITCPNGTTKDSDLGLANYNEAEVTPWIHNIITNAGPDKGAAYIRFVLTYILNMGMPGGAKFDLNVYQQDYELVYYKDPDSTNNDWIIDFPNQKNKGVLHKFTPNGPLDFENGSDSSGTMTLLLGICNNREYQLKQWFSKVGKWILLTILGFAILIVVLRTRSAKANKNK
jgi:hypothetical protein